MKKLSPKRKAFLCRHAKMTHAHTLSRRRKRQMQGGSGYSVNPKSWTIVGHEQRRRIVFRAPAVLCLENNQKETFSFFNDLLEAVSLKNPMPISIDFGELRSLTASAALGLAAILDCWSKGGTRKIRLFDKSKWHLPVYQLLNDMGMFDLLSVVNPPESNGETSNYEFLKFFSKDCVDGSVFRPLRQQVEDKFGRIYRSNKLYSAVIEAMTNAAQHAYPVDGEPLPNAVPKKWWSFGGYNWTTGELTICFCDLGVGIPGSLPTKYPMEYINMVLETIRVPVNHHAKMIQAAMMVGRSKTGRRTRGKGLNEMRQIVDSNSGSVMKVYSQKGVYTYSHGAKEELFDADGAMPGTMIEWRFALEREQMNLPLVQGGVI